MIKEAYGDAVMVKSGIFEKHKLFWKDRVKWKTTTAPDVLRPAKTDKSVLGGEQFTEHWS